MASRTFGVEKLEPLELTVKGMDCAHCAATVEKTLAALPGVTGVEVLLSAEKARLQHDPRLTDGQALRRALENAGYRVPEEAREIARGEDISGAVLKLFGLMLGVVLFVVVAGEWFGLFETLTERVPFAVGAALVVLFGYPIFRNVFRAALNRRVTSHTLMTMGALAALAIGEWATAAVVVFFMRVGDYVEGFTTDRARSALRNLSALAPETARLENATEERVVPIAEVRVGDTVVIRPGERIPADGEVISGNAVVNQASITGESMPLEVSCGSTVYAATIALYGSLRVRVTGVGETSTFGKVVKQVEEAETNRGEMQRLADRFSALYLPLVAGIALLTYLLSGNLLSAVAVTVVACSCAFALATPVAILASVGTAARQGVLIKGGKYLEALASADVLLVDKTGTLTLGKPALSGIVALGNYSETDILTLAAGAERDSEHPLAEAVREAARARNIIPPIAHDFSATPGEGVSATVEGQRIRVGSRRLVSRSLPPEVTRLEQGGDTLLFVLVNDTLAGVLAAADTLRPEVPKALERVRALGIKHIELLTGDNERTAATLAGAVGIAYRANLLPEDKIAIVRSYQAQGHKVVMVGDGVNDAPALVQADVGIAMGAAGTDIAIQAAHIALLRDDWALVPEALAIAQRTMRVVKGNIAFTALYNLVAITLAALGFLPPIFAAALQSLPDLGIMANSARLLRR